MGWKGRQRDNETKRYEERQSVGRQSHGQREAKWWETKSQTKGDKVMGDKVTDKVLGDKVGDKATDKVLGDKVGDKVLGDKVLKTNLPWYIPYHRMVQYHAMVRAC